MRTFAKEKTSSTSLADLLIQDQYRSLENCDLKSIKLLLKEKAKNLRSGRWLITSAHSKFKLQERRMNSSLPLPVEIHEGCTVCIITIRCGHEIQGPNIHLKSDLETCSKEPAQRVDVQLSNPLYDLFNDFPELDSFPHLPDIATARIKLFQEVQKQIIRLPEEQKSDPVQIRALKQPITFQMQQLRATQTEHMSGFTSINSH